MLLIPYLCVAANHEPWFLHGQLASSCRQEGCRGVGVRRGHSRCESHSVSQIMLCAGRISVKVKQIFVEPELRKRGLGKLLLDGMMQAEL